MTISGIDGVSPLPSRELNNRASSAGSELEDQERSPMQISVIRFPLSMRDILPSPIKD